MPLPDTRESAFKFAKDLANKEGKTELYESLVVQYTNPQGEWGKNNIRDLIVLFHMSGKTDEQIYNILYNMGIDKERAYSAIQTYIPQKNTVTMTVKEHLDFTDTMRNLVDAMNEYKTPDSANYNTDAVIGVCETYLNTPKDHMSTSQLASLAKRAISDMNQYDFISAVKECIDSIENKMFEHIMSIEVDSTHAELSNSNAKNMYGNIIDRLNSLKAMNEEDIRKNINTEVGSFKGWVPRVKVLLEKAEMISGVNMPEKTKTLSERFNLKGKIKTIVEKSNDFATEDSKFTVKSIKEICERYLNKLYSNNNTVSESQIASGLFKELSNFMWLDFIKESLQEVVDFVQENYMSFEVESVARNLQKTNESSFYGPAIVKLNEIKGLTESEIREQIKYGMDALTWVPQVKALIETVNSIEGNLSASNDATISRKYSPVLEQNGKVYFYLSGAVYCVHESTITMIDPKTMGALFLTLISVTENFKFGPGTMTLYKGKDTVDITLTESGPVFKHNGKEIAVKEGNDIRNYLLSTGAFRINETSALDMVVKAFENVEQFVELDFVHSVNSRIHKGVTTNVIKLDETIYVNRVNPAMGVNEMIKAETASHAIELVKEYVNYDISAVIVEQLQGEQKAAAKLAAKKNDLFDRIQFLKEQRSKIAEQDLRNDAILEADKLLVSEIEKWQKELNQLATQKA